MILAPPPPPTPPRILPGPPLPPTPLEATDFLSQHHNSANNRTRSISCPGLASGATPPAMGTCFSVSGEVSCPAASGKAPGDARGGVVWRQTEGLLFCAERTLRCARRQACSSLISVYFALHRTNRQTALFVVGAAAERAVGSVLPPSRCGSACLGSVSLSALVLGAAAVAMPLCRRCHRHDGTPQQQLAARAASRSPKNMSCCLGKIFCALSSSPVGHLATPERSRTGQLS